MLILHDAACAAYQTPGHPERPVRVTATAAHLQQVFPSAVQRAPPLAGDEDLLLAHTPGHLARLREEGDFDADTPWHDGIDRIARLGAGACIAGAEAALAGEKPFVVMRPPGHHAMRRRAMGFCYLSNAAIAALAAQARGARRVAVWDFDAHHGNGTEDVLRGRAGTSFSSVHQYPGYPGTGLYSSEAIHNFPVAPGTPAEEHMEALESSWKVLQKHRPDLIVVSAGFDAYHGDPITELALAREDFVRLGRWCSQARAPIVALLEGGYSDELPLLVEAFLEGWWHA